VQGKDGEGRRVPDPVNPTSRLEDFRRAGVHLGRAVEMRGKESAAFI
jgi:hypothetical protein